VADCDAFRTARLARDRGEGVSPALARHLATCGDCAREVARIDAVDAALNDLARETLPPPPFGRLEAAARSAARSRRQWLALRRILPVTFAFASAAALTAGVARIVHHYEHRRAVSGDVVDAAHGVAHAVLADGASLTVTTGRAVLDVSEQRRARVRLETGAAFVSVPHLGTGETFVLATDEAEVHVRGTRFDVARLPQGTQVSVTEGTVEVRPRVGPPRLLARGESSLFESQPQRWQQARAAALASIGDSASDKIQAWLDAAPPAQEAAEAHALLAWKLSREGRRDEALTAYRRALGLLPPGAAPLWADNASAQLALLVEHADPSQAVAAWRAYLERFPAGVHAARARERLARDARSEHARP
jgi:ferric-dicitrate binding protein FerR (iron transport regulator)